MIGVIDKNTFDNAVNGLLDKHYGLYYLAYREVLEKCRNNTIPISDITDMKSMMINHILHDDVSMRDRAVNTIKSLFSDEFKNKLATIDIETDGISKWTNEFDDKIYKAVDGLVSDYYKIINNIEDVDRKKLYYVYMQDIIDKDQLKILDMLDGDIEFLSIHLKEDITSDIFDLIRLPQFDSLRHFHMVADYESCLSEIYPIVPYNITHLSYENCPDGLNVHIEENNGLEYLYVTDRSPMSTPSISITLIRSRSNDNKRRGLRFVKIQFSLIEDSGVSRNEENLEYIDLGGDITDEDVDIFSRKYRYLSQRTNPIRCLGSSKILYYITGPISVKNFETLYNYTHLVYIDAMIVRYGHNLRIPSELNAKCLKIKYCHNRVRLMDFPKLVNKSPANLLDSCEEFSLTSRSHHSYLGHNIDFSLFNNLKRVWVDNITPRSLSELTFRCKPEIYIRRGNISDIIDTLDKNININLSNIEYLDVDSCMDLKFLKDDRVRSNVKLFYLLRDEIASMYEDV